MDKKGHLFSISELSSLLKVSVKTVRRYIKDGKIQSTKIGGVHRIYESDLKKFIDYDEKELLGKKDQFFPYDSKIPEGSLEKKWSNHKQKITRDLDLYFPES